MSMRPDKAVWLRLALGSACSLTLAGAMVTMPASVFPLWVRVCGLVLGVLIGCVAAGEVVVWIVNAWHRRSERGRTASVPDNRQVQQHD
ncbi:hypothetical protein ABN034_10450 [Actinopolymorpha sp. B11F2]|uniref:hypothetical protein n=1 Tax=Actinopolymorpha sp. B11F2 TaxID=3160862 RepID=UPI0032E48F13